MRPITITLAKIKAKKKLISWGSVLLLAVIILAGYFLITEKRFPEINLAGLLTALRGREEPKEQPEKLTQEKPEGIEIILPPEPKIYEQEAKEGDGITHLARRALKEYLTEKGMNLSPEQKIFAEDYIQNKTGDYWLSVGQKLTFSEDLINEAVQKAQQLTPEQIENLKQFAQLVPELNY